MNMKLVDEITFFCTANQILEQSTGIKESLAKELDEAGRKFAENLKKEKLEFLKAAKNKEKQKHKKRDKKLMHKDLS